MARSGPCDPSTESPFFPNLPVVWRSISLLFHRLTTERILAYPGSIPRTELRIRRGDKFEDSLQVVAKNLLKYFGLGGETVAVNISGSTSAGRILLHPHQPASIEIASSLNGNKRVVRAILAHEICHLFLFREGICLPVEFDNEVLTDVAACLLGVGWPFLEAHEVWPTTIPTEGKGGTQPAVGERCVGYLTPPELGYILAKRHALTAKARLPWLRSVAARQAYRQGERRACQEFMMPPLAAAGFMAFRRYSRIRSRAIVQAKEKGRLDYELRQWFHIDDAEMVRVVFRCPACGKLNRLPTNAKGKFLCPVCGFRSRFRS